MNQRTLHAFELSFRDFSHEADIPGDFESCGLSRDDDTHPVGTRRGLFRSYVAHVDWSNPDHASRGLAALSLHMRRLEARFELEQVSRLHEMLHADGLCYVEGEISGREGQCRNTELQRVRWDPRCFQLFISHLSRDRAKVSTLAGLLRTQHQVSGFVSHVDITPSTEWQREIEEALFEMHALLAVFAPGYGASAWTDQEIGVAIGRGIPVVNVSLGADPHGFVGRWQAIPAVDRDLAEVAADIVNVLTGFDSCRQRLGEAFAVLFAGSRSYQAASENMALLECVAPLSPNAIGVALDGFKANGECRYSTGVAERLQSLIPFDVDVSTPFR